MPYFLKTTTAFLSDEILFHREEYHHYIESKATRWCFGIRNPSGSISFNDVVKVKAPIPNEQTQSMLGPCIIEQMEHALIMEVNITDINSLFYSPIKGFWSKT